MAPKKDTDVHLETMETTEDTGEEPDKTRYAGMESVS